MKNKLQKNTFFGILLFLLVLLSGCESVRDMADSVIADIKDTVAPIARPAQENSQTAKTRVSTEASNPNAVKITYCQTEARSMLSSINQFRTTRINTNDASTAWYTNKNGTKKSVPNLEPLVYDYDLEVYAMTRAAELAYNGSALSHTRPNGKISTSGFSGNAKGENIAYGQRTAQEVFVSWREDNLGYDREGHRRNMLESRFGAIAIGCAERNGVKYWVQVFRDKTVSTKETPAENGRQEVVIEKK